MPSLSAHPPSETPLAGLRSQMNAIAPPARHGRLALDGGAVDAALGGGLALGALHSVEGAGIEAETGTAPAWFLLILLARLPGTAPVFWLAPTIDLYPPGLLTTGFNPARLIQIRTDASETLATMETILRSKAAAAVVAELEKIPSIAGRRLQMACLSSATTGFVLRRFPHGRKPVADLAAAVTRWRLSPAPSLNLGITGKQGTRQHVELLHTRSGPPAAWILQQEFSDAPHPFRVGAGLADQAAPSRRLAG